MRNALILFLAVQLSACEVSNTAFNESIVPQTQDFNPSQHCYVMRYRQGLVWREANIVSETELDYQEAQAKVEKLMGWYNDTGEKSEYPCKF